MNDCRGWNLGHQLIYWKNSAGQAASVGEGVGGIVDVSVKTLLDSLTSFIKIWAGQAGQAGHLYF